MDQKKSVFWHILHNPAGTHIETLEQGVKYVQS